MLPISRNRSLHRLSVSLLVLLTRARTPLPMSCLFARSTTTAVYGEYPSPPDCDSIDAYDQNNFWGGFYLSFDTDTIAIILKGLDLNKVKPDFHSNFRNYKVLNYSDKNGFSVFQLTKTDNVNAYTPGYFGLTLIDQNDSDSAGLGTFKVVCKPPKPIWQVGPAMPLDKTFPFYFEGGTFGVETDSGLRWNSGMFKDAPEGIEDAPIVASWNIGNFVQKMGLGKAGHYGAYGTLEEPFYLTDMNNYVLIIEGIVFKDGDGGYKGDEFYLLSTASGEPGVVCPCTAEAFRTKVSFTKGKYSNLKPGSYLLNEDMA